MGIAEEMKYPIRSVFIAPKGYTFLAFDLSQAETWVVAHLAKEPTMQHALKTGDIHRLTASVLYSIKEEEVTSVQRYAGKQNNHAQSYRMGWARLMEVFNKNSDKPPYLTISATEAKRMASIWHGLYHLKGWWDEIEQRLSTTRTITTIYGRQRMFFGQWGEELFKAATAHEPQSTVADHALGAIQPEVGVEGGILSISRRLTSKYKSIKLVHTAYDSVMLEIPENLVDEIAPQAFKYMYRPMMIHGVDFIIPVDGDFGPRWGEMTKFTKDQVKEWQTI